MPNQFSTGSWFPNLSPQIADFSGNLFKLKMHEDDLAARIQQMKQQQDQFSVGAYGKLPQDVIPRDQTIATRQLNATIEAKQSAEAAEKQKMDIELAKLDAAHTPVSTAQIVGRAKSAGVDKVLKPELDQVSATGLDANIPNAGVAHEIISNNFKQDWPGKRADMLNRLQDDLSSKIAKDQNYENTPEGKKQAALMDQIYADQTGDFVPDLIFPGVRQAKELLKQKAKAELAKAQKDRYIQTDQGLFDTTTQTIVPGTGKAAPAPQIRTVDKGNVIDIYENGVRVRTEKKGKSPGSEGQGTNLPGGGTGSFPAGAPGEINTGALQGLSRAQQDTVKAIAEYRFPVSNLRNKEMMALVQRAYSYDPTFDAKEYGVRSNVRKDFTSGTSSKTMLSLNTAIGHLEALADAGKSLDNGSVQLWNKIVNYGLTQTGDPRVTKFNTAATAVAGELATVFKNTSGTDQEIKAWRDNLSAVQSPQQIKDGGVDEAVKLIGSRLDNLQYKYEQGMGRKVDFQILSPKSKRILKGLGFDVNKYDPATAPSAPGAKAPTGAAPKKIGRFIVETE
jgi:hypothetical protein